MALKPENVKLYAEDDENKQKRCINIYERGLGKPSSGVISSYQFNYLLEKYGLDANSFESKLSKTRVEFFDRFSQFKPKCDNDGLFLYRSIFKIN